jgi:membrane protein
MISPSANSRSAEIGSADPEQTSVSASHQNSRPKAQARSCGLGLLLKPKATFALLRATCSEWSRDKVPRMGAALAYYTIFSLAPLLVIAIAIAGLVFGVQAAQGEITGQIQGLIGWEGAKAVQAMIQSAHKPAHSAIASMVGVLALLLGASGVFSEMQDALNSIWHVSPGDKSGVWNLVKARFMSFGMVLGIGFLLLVSLLFSAVLAALAKYV